MEEQTLRVTHKQAAKDFLLEQRELFEENRKAKRVENREKQALLQKEGPNEV